MFSRDSMFWGLIIIGAVATYLSAMPPPLTWTWAQWMATIAATTGIVAAKMGSSPLKDKPTTTTTTSTISTITDPPSPGGK